MKKFPRIFQGALILLVAFVLALSMMAARFTQAANQKLGAGVLLAQTTPTVETQGASEIGSTDGIVLMGVIIVMIVVVPIMLRRKSWSQN